MPFRHSPDVFHPLSYDRLLTRRALWRGAVCAAQKTQDQTHNMIEFDFERLRALGLTPALASAATTEPGGTTAPRN